MSSAIKHWLCHSLLALGFLAACGPSSKVPTASCQTCSATEAMCQAWGAASGCKSSSYKSGSGSSCASCSYTDCDEPPSCGTYSGGTQDAGTKDAGIDPTCKTADPDGDGLFSSKPPCVSPREQKINGLTRYTCPCGACPCGYECGSIALASGGFLSSVCAPPAK